MQAATGAERHVAIQALLRLHLELSFDTTANDQVFNSRLARVVNKLFARVVKAEDSCANPFSPSSVDTVAILRSLQQTLAYCDEAEDAPNAADAVKSSRNQVMVLLAALLKARGGDDAIRSEMESVGIDPFNSALGVSVTSCSSSLSLPKHSSSQISSSSRDVASLVSALGSSQPGSERLEAINELRRYKIEHGDKELNAHLQEVSAAFRDFVLDQLSEKETKSSSKEPSSANSMSERIKSLRSKLNATEAVVQSAVDKSATGAMLSGGDTSGKVRSSIPGPSPSKIPSPRVASAHPSVPSNVPTVKAFRERLAAAQEKRSASSDGTIATSQLMAPSAGGRAAALRARLQAVKKQSEQTN